MKWTLAALLIINSVFAANGDTFTFSDKSLSQTHNGDTWVIHTFGTVSNYKVSHATLKSNSVSVKWNIKKGRMTIKCDGLCNDEDEYIIRLFDKDTLRIQYVTPIFTTDKALSDDEYIVPSNIRKDIAFMEIKPLRDDWTPEYDVTCDDGYILSSTAPDDMPYTLFIYPLFSECIRNTDNINAEESVSSLDWQTDNNDCPPSWQDDNGGCKAGWYN